MSVPSRRWQNSRSPETNNAGCQSHQLSANVKKYLGLQAIVSCSLDTCPEGEALSFSTSSKSISPPSTRCTPYRSSSDNLNSSITEPSNRKKHCCYGTATNTVSNTCVQYRHTNESNSNRIVGNTCSDFTRKLIHAKFKPTILLEDIPHSNEAPQTIRHHQTRKHKSFEPTRRNHRLVSSAAKFRQQAFAMDLTNEIEIDADLDDIDSYMMSVYMNEESSVYSKGTASTVSTSSSSLTSNRSRHRGASHKRRTNVKQTEEGQPQKESGFLRSMRESSNSFFVPGNWTPKYGWYISKKWDAAPGETWEQPNPIFDNEDKLFDM